MQNNDRRDYQAFPRAIAIAETGWTLNANKNWSNFCERMATDFERLDAMNVKACRNFYDVNIYTKVNSSGVLNVVLDAFYPNAQIYYTTDGSEPTSKATLYTQPFALQGRIDLKAAAFKEGEVLGKVNQKALYGNKIAGKRYTVTPAAGWLTGDILGENDVLGADTTTLALTNGKRGNSASFIPWVSFAMNDRCKEVEFIVNLDQPTPISKVVFGSQFNPAYRNMPASAATVEISADGKQYRQVAEASFTHQFPERGRKAYTDSLTFEPTEATFVKVKIKNGGTLRNGIDCRKDTPEELIQADLYLDEIEIY